MRTNRDKRLINALKLAMGSGLAAAVISIPVASAAEEEATELERVQVTGSRITRLDLEGALPVTVIDREQIDLSGQISVADLLRQTSFNSAGSFRPQSGNTAQSFAGVALRGLTEGRTLILVDGRRAPVAPNVGNAQDLNSIPLAAVERIEILSDGASAVYGSDAIGGVINIITRKDFTGAEVTVGASNPAREGGDTAEFSALMGAAGDRGQIMFGVSRNHRDIIFQRERPWSTGGASIYSNNYHFIPIAGNFYFNQTHGAAVPGDGCTGPGFTLADPGEESLCFYDFTLQAADEAEIENQSLFARGTYELNANWTNYFNAQVSRVESFGRYAPVPSSPFPGGLPFLEFGSPNHPATRPEDGGLNPNWADYQIPGAPVLCPTPEDGEEGDPSEFIGPDDATFACNAGDLMYHAYDPTGGAGGGLTPQYGSQDLYFSHRFAALGPRDTSTDAHVYDATFGFQGSIGRFDLDIGLRNTESKYIELGRNYVVGGLAQIAIDSGDYNIYDPFSVEADVANSMIATINRESIFTSQEIYAIAGTDLFDMPAGMVSMAFGGEYRDEEYVDNFDSLSEGGQVVGSAGNSAGGGRNVSAAFFELLFPLLDTLEMNLAGRYDRYSDYGSDFSPKLSARWQPMDELTLRGSYGQGFRAPTLDILTQQPSFDASPVVHAPSAVNLGVPATQSIQVTSYSIANPNLESEQSDQFAFGVAFEPTTWFSGSVDYFNITITNQITEIDANRVLQCLEGRSDNCPSGLSVLPSNLALPTVSAGLGAGFQSGPNSPVLFVQYGSTNLGELSTDGFDVNLRSKFELGQGELSNNLQMTFVNSYEVDGEDIAGKSQRPDFRAKLDNVYAFGDFSVAWNINFIGAQDTSEAGDDLDENDDPIPGTDPGVDSWLTHDLQTNWFTPWNGRVTVGVLNVTDEDPPLDGGESRGFNFNLYDGYGRLPYLRYTQSF